VEIAHRHVGDDGRVLQRELLDEALGDPECAAVTAELSMAEPHYDDVQAYVRGCLQTLARKRRERALEELISQLKAAEREGRAEDARQLNDQVNALRVTKAGSGLSDCRTSSS